jgi:tetratricopeptide (TPR) repeat protein
MLFGKMWPAVIAGLLFGLHPLTVEPVAWVSERKTLLACFFALWCLVFYVWYARKGALKLLAVCMLMYILALMSKPTTTPVAILLLLLDWWPLGRLNKRALLEKIPFFVVMAGFALITVVSQANTAMVTMPTQYSPLRIPLILCHNIVFYLYKIVWPANLSSHYAFPDPMSISHPMVLTGVIGTAVLIVLLFVSLRMTRVFVAGWLFFFIAILPTMGIIGFTNVIASDKYAYFPSLGFLMIFVWLIGERFAGLWKSSFSKAVIVAVVLILGVSESIVVRRYLVQWQDTEKFYRYMLSMTPNSAPVHLNLANTILKKDRPAEAIKHYGKSIEAWPGFTQAHFNLGIALSSVGQYRKAVEEFSIVLKQGRKDAEVLSKLAYALARSGQLDSALSYYEQALKLRPNDAEILNNYGLALVQKGRLEEAVGVYKRSLEINSDSVEVMNNLGNALSKQNKPAEAVVFYRKALLLSPDFAETHYNIAGSLKRLGETAEAISHYEHSIRLRPDDVDSHYGLGLALAELKRYDEATDQYNKAIELDPNNAAAYYNLGLVYFNKNQSDKAIEQFRQVLRIFPDDAEMHCNVGVLLARMGRAEDAAAEFREAIRLDPKLLRARQGLESLKNNTGGAGNQQ